MWCSPISTFNPDLCRVCGPVVKKSTVTSVEGRSVDGFLHDQVYLAPVHPPLDVKYIFCGLLSCWSDQRVNKNKEELFDDVTQLQK